jgi:plastocyanin
MRLPRGRGQRALAAALLLLPLAAGAGGVVEGRVTLSGPKPPPPAVLDTSSDPACAKAHLLDETLLLGGKDGRGVANVVVRLKGPPPASPASTTPVRLEQQACAYRPRVQGAVLGQPIEVLNADAMLHNVHAYAGTKGLFNVAQPPGSQMVSKPSPTAPGPVRFKCDIHRWMVAFVVYGESPFFAVTDKDGAFQLQGLPPGSWELEVWHESLGTLTLKVEVKEGARVRVPVAYQPH